MWVFLGGRFEDLFRVRGWWVKEEYFFFVDLFRGGRRELRGGGCEFYLGGRGLGRLL